MKVVKSLFGSRKYWLTLLGTALAFTFQQLGLPAELYLGVLGIFGLEIASIAYEDKKK